MRKRIRHGRRSNFPIGSTKSTNVFAACSVDTGQRSNRKELLPRIKILFRLPPGYLQIFREDGNGPFYNAGERLEASALPAQATVSQPIVPPPTGQPETSRIFTVSHNESGWEQRESVAGEFSVDHQLDYAVGSGYNGLTFLVRRGRFLFQAPLSYYARAQKWDLSPGYENADLGFNRMVPEECINCHAGRPSPLPNVSGGYADPPFQELAIGCENCHGPGEAHVKSQGKRSGTIVNPAKLGARLADNICLNCHQAGDARVTQPGKSYLDFRPGEWLFDTTVIFKQPAAVDQPQADLLEHYAGMQASLCFRESGGKLSCLTCHDPHTQPSQTAAASYYRPKCLTCHNEQSCRLPLRVRGAQTPADDCIGCHMPKRNVTQISHSALTNHRIPAREGEPPPPLKQEEKEGVIVVNPPEGRKVELSKLTLLRAYRQLSQKNPDYQRRYLAALDEVGRTQPQDTFVQAALGDRGIF